MQRSRRAPRTDLAYVLVRIVVYLAVLVPIVFIFSTGERALVVAPSIGLICAAATWYLLGDTPARRERRLLLAAGVGVVVAELAWGIGYWAVVPLVRSAESWLAFYVLAGIVEHGAARTLDPRIALEYGLVAAVGTLVLLVFVFVFTTPWRAQIG